LADQLIQQVQYSAAETHIDKVVSHDNGETVSDCSEIARETVVSRLDGGSTY
jgi:hypothetical protein